MNKKKIASFVSLGALVLAIISYFLPFVAIENYKPVSGMQFIISVFRRITIERATADVTTELSIYSYALPLLLAFVAFVAAGVLLFLYLRGGKARLFNFALGGTLLGFLLYGIQLSNSNSLVSDFFGMLAQVVDEGNGKKGFTVPNVDNVTTGLGARLLVVFALIAVLAIILTKIFEHEERDKEARIQTPLSIAYRQFKRNKLALLGLFVLLGLLFACFYGPVFSNYALLQTDISIAKERPSLSYLFGTDAIGRDVLTRLLYGGRISLEVGIVTVLVEILIGTTIGGIAGFYGKWVDNILMRVLDVFLSLPLLPVVIIIGAVMMDLKVEPSQRIYFVMIVLGLFFWPSLARLVRGQILSLREQEYMIAADALGIGDRHRIFRHLVPNALPSIIVTATLDVGNAIMIESTLSYLGLGVAMPYASWGNIINAVADPNDFMLRPWLWIPAGVCILITVLSINFVGDGLRDAFDPKMKR